MKLAKIELTKKDVYKHGQQRGLSSDLSARYFIHAVLGELFAGRAKPADYQDRGRAVRVLTYLERRPQDLAKMAASPESYEVARWDRCAVKDMPEEFPSGMELRFDLRASPVVTKSSAGEGRNHKGEKKTWSSGTEMDAFLSQAWESEENDVTRQGAYRRWLERQLEGFAELESFSLKQYSLPEMTRRVPDGDGGRRVTTFQNPDVAMTGTLLPKENFVSLLDRGVGHHKAFGYGMMKVRPA
ncbi:type I-E CRISPR-associated protein Cas6/Cse3/CasE [Salinibacter ruber]|uniref:type I-E CRISPR-associated protein Cas6/Cse3/CasE n=1 Tax=Salinibacter ruber TaxID=146919 RepID=UPI00216A84A4|nr:type I-E CRISPR-associated protein Cas6/Cse3/CasE [Salinibacter ruber]MCS4054097.1 CRISPR system Cascade subunit CasE [Salinibacter ruber]